MKTILKLISYAGLALTVGPSFLVFIGTIDLSTHKTLMIIGTLMWFLTVPFWLGKEKKESV